MFYLNGKHFCLGGGKEHHSLKISQVVRNDNPVHYVYAENGSMNWSGGQNKTIPVFPCPKAGIRCHVNVLDAYLRTLPPIAFEKDWFYMKPLKRRQKKSGTPRSPVENKLGEMVKSTFSKVGVVGKTKPQPSSNWNLTPFSSKLC